MKKFLLLCIIAGFFASCARATAQGAEVNSPVLEKNTEGIIPVEHPFYDIIKDPDSYSIKDIDSYYRKEFLKVDTPDYIPNLKNYAFKILMEKGLPEHGTQEEKLFYLNEQLRLDDNFPNINNFYSLLLSSRDFLKDEELTGMADAFYEKNNKSIEKATWPTETQKRNKEKTLRMAHRKFRLDLRFH
ncbi:hypothetical protein CHU92_11455 [Flavobacterium cyanobacteriorum]|uniref:Uncharacterized protein n=1 Tax=Flavobacterium cyanobacteriorum TaxID=2022802 RepID=A0A255Z1C3_9FLAO|nr:hypothetical protein [Flavobacterium cyanobacteriorum]OYQ34705.1 hypothetical protein CHU92_11455 [Flavobacterium cyanobacteriorum]